MLYIITKSACQAQQLKEQLRSAQVAGQWRGDTALTLPLFWRRSTVSPVFFGRFPWSSQSPCPLPTLSPSQIGHPASVDVKQHKRMSGDRGRGGIGGGGCGEINETHSVILIGTVLRRNYDKRIWVLSSCII